MPIQDQHKYACYALRTGLRGLEPGAVVPLGDGVVATREAPVDLPAHWRDRLGSVAAEWIASADLFITATAPSEQPRVLDGENRALVRRVRRIYSGLLVATPGIRLLQGWSLTGAVHGTAPDLRHFQPLDRVYAVVGASRASAITRGHLRHAVGVADGIAEVQRLAGTDGYGDFGRLTRALNAMYTCLGNRHLDVRLHQALRVPEASLSAGEENFRAVVKPRAERLLGDDPELTRWPDTLYQLRNKVEHMYGPIRAVRLAKLVEPWESDAAALTLFARATHAAEFLAQSMLTRVLSTPTLWPHFSADNDIAKFWDSSEVVARWGPAHGPGLRRFMTTFDRAAVERAFEDADEEAL